MKNRGVEDIFIACVDGLKGFPDAMQCCLIGQNTTDTALCGPYDPPQPRAIVSWKEKKYVTTWI